MIMKKLFGMAGTPTERRGDRVVEHTPSEQHSSQSPGKAGAERDDATGWMPTNALEEQMAQIPHSAEAQFAFARLLVRSDVLLATVSSPTRKGERTLEQDESFQVLCVDDNKGGTAAALFTSEARLTEAFGAGAPYVKLNGRTALEAVSATGAIINPGSGLWTFYDPPTIKRIVGGEI